MAVSRRQLRAAHARRSRLRRRQVIGRGGTRASSGSGDQATAMTRQQRSGARARHQAPSCQTFPEDGAVAATSCGQATGSGASSRQAARPGTSSRQATRPGTSSSQATRPGTSSDQATGPGTSSRQAARPGTSSSQATGPGTSSSQATGPSTSSSQATRPGTSSDQATGPGTSSRQATRPGTSSDQATGPGTSSRQVARPGTSSSQATRPGTSSDQATGPGTSSSRATRSATSSRQATRPGTSSDQATGPGTSSNVLVTRNVSTKRKVNQSKKGKEPVEDCGTNAIISAKKLVDYLDTRACNSCRLPALKHRIINYQCDVIIEKRCTVCMLVTRTTLVSNNETLKALVLSNMLAGQGYRSFLNMNRGLSMSGVSRKDYKKFRNMIGEKAREKWLEVQAESHDKIVDYYCRELNRAKDEEGFLDIDVFFDGLWHTKEHPGNSQVGIAFLVEIFTGLVVDYNVFHKKCKQCQTFDEQKREGNLTEAEYEEKKMEHVPHCHRNYSDTAENMEGDAAVVLWHRSKDYKLRYMTFVSDGERSAYHKVCALNNGAGPYGAQKKIEKPNIRMYFMGKRQNLNNLNKSLHQRVWHFNPEDTFVSRTMTDFCIATTAVTYNVGYTKGYLDNLIGIPRNEQMARLLKKMDEKMEKSTRCTKKPKLVQ
nr:uncharacterized protein LOC123767968 [Procambarus clarkii]